MFVHIIYAWQLIQLKGIESWLEEFFYPLTSLLKKSCKEVITIHFQRCENWKPFVIKKIFQLNKKADNKGLSRFDNVDNTFYRFASFPCIDSTAF